jgi:crotonobetainyl-CoA:carnitine CoA-transferase CaiB-like acyl-CoA transferase
MLPSSFERALCAKTSPAEGGESRSWLDIILYNFDNNRTSFCLIEHMSEPEKIEQSGDGLLAGVRVLDLTNVLAGPFCGYQLALQGADVIKVEIPDGGDLARQLGASAELNRNYMGASFLAQNAGKRSLTLDLKKPAGADVFRSLVQKADVVLENFRPGVMDRLGLGYGALKEHRAGLIYCAISGFGQDGPLRKNPAYDQIIQGLSGVMSLTGDANMGPFRVGYPVCDTIGGITAAFAICSALYRRKSTGEGTFIDVSMLDATMVTLGWPLSNWLIAGVEPQRMGNENVTASPSGTFRTGAGMLNIAANKQEQFLTLCDLLGLVHLVSDNRFAEREARKAHRAELTALLEEALLRRSAEEWERMFNDAGVPAGRVLELPDAVAHPQIRHRGLLQTFDAVPGIADALTVVGAGFQVGGRPAAASSPPPRLGEHSGEVLVEFGYGLEEIEKLRAEGVL